MLGIVVCVRDIVINKIVTHTHTHSYKARSCNKGEERMEWEGVGSSSAWDNKGYSCEEQIHRQRLSLGRKE